MINFEQTRRDSLLKKEVYDKKATSSSTSYPVTAKLLN